LKNIISLPILLCLFGWLNAQHKSNYALIDSTDSYADILTKAANVTPSERQLRWQKLELTAFFHFGINTFTDKEWGDGKENPALFNPSKLNCKQWVWSLKKAGFKQVILTAKHHDGFCLWQTSTTEHSVKNSPWKNGSGDVVRELSNACKKMKIGFGIYLSPWDRNAASYGTDEYNRFFERQLTELLTQYGQVDEVWFDGANGEGPNGKKQLYDFMSWYALIRNLQPQATIAIMGPDVRWVGTETGKGRFTEWSVLPMNHLNLSIITMQSQKDVIFKPMGDLTEQDLGGRNAIMTSKALVWYPAETDVSIRPGWFYHASQDSLVKTPEKLMDIYLTSVGMNSVLLLNVPPDREGLVSRYDLKSLTGFKTMLDKTFKKNLVRKSKVTCLNGLRVEYVLDGKYETYFTTKGIDTTTILEFTLKKPATFNLVSLQENISVGQRIEKFELEYLNGSNRWEKLTEGTTIGFKRIMKFKETTAEKLRLNILSSRLNPTISEFGLHLLNEKISTP
jgi:alpha-L-fucosidase